MLGLAENSTTVQTELEKIAKLDEDLTTHFVEKLELCRALSRLLVSFQADKSRPIYRWYKYKEGFSAALIEYFLEKYKLELGTILDPFAGSGAALFVAAEKGLQAEGIEVLPIGQLLIEARKVLEADFSPEDFAALKRWTNEKIWEKNSERAEIPELRITALVTFIFELRGIQEPSEIAETDGQGENRFYEQIADSKQNQADELEGRERLKRLWEEICQLPPRHRAALLLNLKDKAGESVITFLPLLRIATIRQIAEALDFSPEHFATVWNGLPWEDLKIAEHLGVTRQQVINLRQSARARLGRLIKEN